MTHYSHSLNLTNATHPVPIQFTRRISPEKQYNELQFMCKRFFFRGWHFANNKFCFISWLYNFIVPLAIQFSLISIFFSFFSPNETKYITYNFRRVEAGIFLLLSTFFSLQIISTFESRGTEKRNHPQKLAAIYGEDVYSGESTNYKVSIPCHRKKG